MISSNYNLPAFGIRYVLKIYPSQPSLEQYVSAYKYTED